MMNAGKNTVSSEQLRSYIERIERIREQKKELSRDEAAIKAEAKAAGFTVSAIAYCIKVRAMKPHDRQESEAMRDMYMHALGMDVEPPLFRAAGLAAIDTTVRDQVIERMSEFVPAHGKGDITVNMGGKPVRLVRDKEGKVSEMEVPDLAPTTLPGKSRKPKVDMPDVEVPDVDEKGAEELGKQYAQDNRPVIDNPFPFGDPRRARFDEGWRKETGGDGMGPDEDDD